MKAECAVTAQVFLGSCSTPLGKQDVDIISFPVIKPIVAVQWKKPSWQCWATSLWKDPASDFSSLVPSPSQLQVGDPRGLLLHLHNTLPSSPSLCEPERWEKRHLELGTGRKVGLGDDFCVWRAALPCEELPPASAAAGDKLGQSRHCHCHGFLWGCWEKRALQIPLVGKKKKSVCPKGKVEL